MSGGLDSCGVLGLAARHHPDPIRAFTLTFDQAAYDEGPIAKEMAELAGAEFHAIPIGSRTWPIISQTRSGRRKRSA